MPRPVISPLTKQLNAELGNRVRVRREELEDEFGGQLFRRERNLTHCTDLGRLMRPHLTAVFEASEGATNQAKDFSVLEKATLNLGVMRTIGPARLIAIIGVPNIPERFNTRTLYSER